jgi:hypothetical protein
MSTKMPNEPNNPASPGAPPLIDRAFGSGLSDPDLLGAATVEQALSPLRSTVPDRARLLLETADQLAYLQAVYWRGWARSCQSGKGDPRFLAGVERCMSRRCALLLTAPTQGSTGVDWTDPAYRRQLAEGLS